MADTTQQGWAKRTVAKGAPGKKVPPKAKGDDAGPDGAQPDEEMDDKSSSDAMDTGAMAKLGEFAEKLKEAAPAIETAIGDLELAAPLGEEEPEDDAKADLAAAAASLPDDVKTGLEENLKPLSYEECDEVCQSLADDGIISDASAMCPALFWMSRLV